MLQRETVNKHMGTLYKHYENMQTFKVQLMNIFQLLIREHATKRNSQQTYGNILQTLGN